MENDELDFPLPSSDYLLTSAEAARALRIGRTAFYRLVREGKLTGVYIGRSVRFRPQDIRGLIRQLRIEAAQQRRPPFGDDPDGG